MMERQINLESIRTCMTAFLSSLREYNKLLIVLNFNCISELSKRNQGLLFAARSKHFMAAEQLKIAINAHNATINDSSYIVDS
jgi:hypothetical protein